MRGKWSNIVNRVVRSTRVPIAELPNPMMRSPSQWPGTARSAASAGRWLIMISGATWDLPRPRLRGRCPVVQATTARGGVASQLPRDRRGRPPQPAGHLPYPLALRATQRDLLPLRERQIPPGERLRRGRKRRWWHATRLPKPPCPYRPRHTHTARSVLPRQARRDRRPEPPPILTPRYPWPTRRPQDTSLGLIRAPLPSAHRDPFVQVLRRPFDSAQYCSIDYQAELDKHAILVSMSGKGNCYDNAMVETFFKTLKSELVWRTVFYTRQQADRAI